MTDNIRLKIQFGKVLINPVTDIAEHFDYPEGASEFEIFLIDQKANLRQMVIQRQWNQIRTTRLLELYTEPKEPVQEPVQNNSYFSKLKKWWNNK